MNKHPYYSVTKVIKCLGTTDDEQFILKGIPRREKSNGMEAWKRMVRIIQYSLLHGNSLCVELYSLQINITSVTLFELHNNPER